MWKYTGIKECNEFLLSLNLFNCKDKNKYIKTIYSITNNIESNYKIYNIWISSTNYWCRNCSMAVKKKKTII